jgi:hypothetical protein
MADGMVLVSKGFPGVTHDARVYDESKTEEKMETINYPADDGTNNEYYHVFGDVFEAQKKGLNFHCQCQY